MKSHWIIGDIHGELGLLDHLLESIGRFDPHQFVFLGDYIDRGPQSRQVIDRIMSLEDSAVCLMGNHEQMMLDAIENSVHGYSPMELWYYNGGEATLMSFGSSSFFSFRSDMEDHYLDFFMNLKVSHLLELPGKRKILCVHAGLSPSFPLEDLPGIKGYRDLIDYQLKKHIDPGDSPLWVREAFFDSPPSLWKDHLVIHGHTPVLKLKRFISSSGIAGFQFIDSDLAFRKVSGRLVSVDIDSGSTLSGRLTALGFFEEEVDGEVKIRMRSLTVSREEIYPRDLGILNSV